MAFGMNDPAVGWGIFVAVKFVGYSIVAHRMKRAYGTSTLPPPLVGATRTVIGILFGVAYGMLSALVGAVVGPLAIALYLGGLVPVRLFEWHLLIGIFFDRKRENPALGKEWRVKGTIASFVLDVPAILGLVKLGDFFLC